MTSTTKTYRADPELAQLLERAARGELRLQIDTDNESYDIYVADTSATKKRANSQEEFEQRRGIWKDYDVEKVRAALDATRGLLDGVDVDELVRRIREDRSDER
jgi:hypothetical protein